MRSYWDLLTQLVGPTTLPETTAEPVYGPQSYPWVGTWTGGLLNTLSPDHYRLMPPWMRGLMRQTFTHPADSWRMPLPPLQIPSDEMDPWRIG